MKRRYRLQVARRVTRVLVLVAILTIPLIAHYEHYATTGKLDQYLDRWKGTFQGLMLSALNGANRGSSTLPTGSMIEPLAERSNRNRSIRQVRGGVWSIEVSGFSLTDPLAGLESIISSRRLHGTLLLSLLIPVLVTVLLGRVFCSWICPMNFLLEGVHKARVWLERLGFRPANLTVSPSTKFVLLGVGLTMSAALAYPVLGSIYPPAVINQEVHNFVSGLFRRAEAGDTSFVPGSLTWLSLFLMGIVLIEISVSRRWWCRTVCPGGLVYSLLGWKRAVRVKHSSSRCTRCGQCVTVCPMGLAPMEDRMGYECDNCGICVAHCAHDALAYSLPVLPRSLGSLSDQGEKATENRRQ